MPLAIALLLLVVTVPLVVALVRANELFVLRVREGRLEVVRGRIPQGLLDDLGDVIAKARVDSGTLRGVSEDGRVRLYAEAALTDGERQRLRNVIGQWPLTRVRNANLRR